MAESNFPDWTKTQTTITQPLLLPDSNGVEGGSETATPPSITMTEECVCVLCDETFTLPGAQPRLLTHLFNEHKLVIGEVNMIADLPAYMAYWKNKFKAEALDTYCAVMKVLKNRRVAATLKSSDYCLCLFICRCTITRHTRLL